MKTPRPLKAIHKHCKWCLGDSARTTEDCTYPPCHLFPYRTGRKPAFRAKHATLKSIRLFCMECNSCITKWTPENDCVDKNCILFEYRKGHNPRLRGKGASKNFSANPTKGPLSGARNDFLNGVHISISESGELEEYEAQQSLFPQIMEPAGKC